ncbi:alpha/beta fold hydrolase [Acinetobacter ihumii]|uniref:alpha/beta fold hydrolase n=1 Tax=Acinetobacter ihumii TaxID=2483802 RepID=UPI003D73A39A
MIALYVVSMGGSIQNAQASDDVFNLQHLLQQERAWAGLKTKTLKVGDITWTYSEGGQANKPTILLIHGLAGSRDNWNQIASALTADYHVIIPDLPMAGDTVVPKDFDLSVPNVTEKLRRFTEAAHLSDQINIVGHSVGGAIAMLYASQYAFDTQSLFLISSAGVYHSANTVYLKDPNYLKQLIVSKKGDLNYVLNQVMYRQPFLSSDFKNAQEQILMSHAQETSKIVDQLAALKRLYTPDTFSILTRSIEAPTLILWGAQDKIINVEAAFELKKTIKHAEAPIILNRVGHMPLLEADQLVIQAYLPFLEKTRHQKNPLTDPLVSLGTR